MGATPGVTKVGHKGQRTRQRDFVHCDSALIPATVRSGIRPSARLEDPFIVLRSGILGKINRALRRFAVLGYYGVLGGPAWRVYVSRQTFRSHSRAPRIGSVGWRNS